MNNQLFKNEEVEIRFFFILVFGLMLMSIFSFILNSRVDRSDNSVPTYIVEKTFPEINIQAKSAIVFDIRNKRSIFEKNADSILPIASLAKIMSAITAIDTLTPKIVEITNDALLSYGDSGLKSGEKWELGDILDFSLLTSSNDGIRAVALALGALNYDKQSNNSSSVENFVKNMNNKANQMGIKSLYFTNETGLDESNFEAGAYGSARDISTLLTNALIDYPQIFEATRETEIEIVSLAHEPHRAINTNNMTPEIPGLIASKTGYTKNAGGNLAFIFDPEIGRPIAVVILGSTHQGRFEDARLILRATFDFIKDSEELKYLDSKK